MGRNIPFDPGFKRGKRVETFSTLMKRPETMTGAENHERTRIPGAP